MLADHCRKESHQALFDSTTLLLKGSGYEDWVIFEALEIALDHAAVKRDVGLLLSPTSRFSPADDFRKKGIIGGSFNCNVKNLFK